MESSKVWCAVLAGALPTVGVERGPVSLAERRTYWPTQDAVASSGRACPLDLDDLRTLLRMTGRSNGADLLMRMFSEDVSGKKPRSRD